MKSDKETEIESFIKNVIATFELENIVIRESTIDNIRRYANREISYETLIKEIVDKYKN